MKRLIILLFISGFAFGQNTEKQKFPYIDEINTDEGLFYSYENIFTNNENKDWIETYLHVEKYSTENQGVYISYGWCRESEKVNAKKHEIIAYTEYSNTYVYSFENTDEYSNFDELIDYERLDDIEINDYKFMYKLKVKVDDSKTFLKLDSLNSFRIDNINGIGYGPTFEIFAYEAKKLILKFNYMSNNSSSGPCNMGGEEIGFILINLDHYDFDYKIVKIESCNDNTYSEKEKLNDNIVIYHCKSNYEDDYDVIIDLDKMSIEKKINDAKK